MRVTTGTEYSRPWRIQLACVRQREYAGIVRAELMLLPQRGHERGEAFVQPQVRPVLAGDQIAEPLVRQLVRKQPVGLLQALARQHRILQVARGQRGSADVFHPAYHELVHHGLVVLVPRDNHAQPVGKIV